MFMVCFSPIPMLNNTCCCQLIGQSYIGIHACIQTQILDVLYPYPSTISITCISAQIGIFPRASMRELHEGGLYLLLLTNAPLCPVRGRAHQCRQVIFTFWGGTYHLSVLMYPPHDRVQRGVLDKRNGYNPPSNYTHLFIG